MGYHNMAPSLELSVIIPVVERYTDVTTLYRSYKVEIEKLNKAYEFIYVLDGDFQDVLKDLQQLRSQGEKIKIVRLSRWFGEATALTTGI